MTERFNGKWKLTRAEGYMEFYEAINTLPEDMERNKIIDDPANDTVDQFMVNGDTIEKHFFFNGEEVFNETFKIGELRKKEYEDGCYTLLTKRDGDKLVDVINRPGTNLKEAHYVKYIIGDKLRVEMTSPEVKITGLLEFTKVKEMTD